MTAVALLCEIIAVGGRTATATYRDDPGFLALQKHGYLRDAGVSKSIVCDGCDAFHTAQVVFEGGRYGNHCPEVGFVALDRSDLQTVLPDLRVLVGQLAGVTDATRRKLNPIHGTTCRVGQVKASAGEVLLYFHPRLQREEDAHDLAQALSYEPRARTRLIITAVGTMPVAGAETVTLDDLVSLNPETGALSLLADPAALAGLPAKNKGGRPTEYGAELAEIILERQHSGAALSGTNAEARAIQTDFPARYPERHVPSLTTIRRHLRKARDGP